MLHFCFTKRRLDFDIELVDAEKMTLAPFAVVLDADGVLFDSERTSLAAFIDAVAEFGPQLDGDDIVANCGQTDAAILSYLAREHGTHIEYEQFKARKFDLYCERVRQEPIRLFDGALELIEMLEAREIPFALASSGSPEKIEFNLFQTALANRFKVIISGEEIGSSKPEPGIFLHAAELLGMPTNRCVVIEDSVNGVAAAKAAGMSCVAVTNTFHRTQLRHADLVVDSLTELSFVRLHDLALRTHIPSALMG
jgi:beta-phosphoglucomutase